MSPNQYVAACLYIQVQNLKSGERYLALIIALFSDTNYLKQCLTGTYRLPIGTC